RFMLDFSQSCLLAPFLQRTVFFLTHPAPTAIYTLSLHDALPIYIPSTKLDASSPISTFNARSKLSMAGNNSLTRSCDLYLRSDCFSFWVLFLKLSYSACMRSSLL